FQRLAGHALYPNPSMRPSSDTIRRGGGGPALLWAQGISGDLPIVLVRLNDIEDIAVVGQLLRAHEYWRIKQLAVDLVILNERAPSYVQDLQGFLETAVRRSQSAAPADGPGPRGSVFIVRADRVTAPQRDVLEAAARAVLSSRHGTLAEQMARAHRPETAASGPPRRPAAAKPAPVALGPPPELELFNGRGGFGAEGREYVTVLASRPCRPAPWLHAAATPGSG